MWAHEFPHPLEDAQAPGTGTLTGIDHIAQTMQYEEFLSWLLFYVGLLDVSKTPQLDIADPMGLVQSQAVETADRAVRFTLNGSLAAQSLSSRFIQNYFGAGVQHIAFETGDIFATAARLRARGLLQLDIPQNYYEDREAQFGLDADLVARLEQGGILYDRDADGEYFQLYSRAFAKTFFFEVVQRRSYEGYGASNAPVRLAAQARFKDETVF